MCDGSVHPKNALGCVSAYSMAVFKHFLGCVSAQVTALPTSTHRINVGLLASKQALKAAFLLWHIDNRIPLLRVSSPKVKQ
jgi:hypothetical protein